MSPLLDDDDDLPRNRNDRELTLSTGAILGIFFGLVLVCALFFVFGYNVGRRSTPVLAGTAADSPYENSASANAAYSSSKPSPGSLTTGSGVAATPALTPINTPPPRPSGESSVTVSPSATAAAKTAPPIVKTEPMPVPIERPAPVPVAPAASFGPGSFVVQVAAVSHQEDAELLVNALQRKGYSVATRNEPGDKLVHIQVGPFSDHKEADVMRQRLIADGFYNPMIKQR